jgi:hypothetical protein
VGVNWQKKFTRALTAEQSLQLIGVNAGVGVLVFRRKENATIISHLKDNGSITPFEALKRYGCMRLGARIFDLRSKGYPIKTEIAKGSKKYAIYKWVEKGDWM